MGGISVVEGIGLGEASASVLGDSTELFVVPTVDELLASWLANAAQAVNAAALTAAMAVPALTWRARIEQLGGCMVPLFPTAKPIKLLRRCALPWLGCSHEPRHL
jgi:hypothetical protein